MLRNSKKLAFINVRNTCPLFRRAYKMLLRKKGVLWGFQFWFERRDPPFGGYQYVEWGRGLGDFHTLKIVTAF